jgi:hypothetical protein
LRLAVTTEVAMLETTLVFTVKVAPVCPAATVTVGGTIAEGSLLDTVTTVPPGAACPERVMVPVELAPPLTLVGFNEMAVTVGEVIVRFSD